MISNSKLITEAYIDMSGTIEGDQVMDDKMHDGEKNRLKKKFCKNDILNVNESLTIQSLFAFLS